MDKVELFVIVIYIAVITSTWMKNRMAMQSYISIYNKKVRYEYFSRNFDGSILRDIMPIRLGIKIKPGINVISPDFMQQWNSALQNTERRLVELLRDETTKIVSLLNVKFETSLEEAYLKNLKAAREHVIKENVHPVESLRRRKNKKWRKFESRVELVQGERNLKGIRIGLSLSIFWIDREEKEICCSMKQGQGCQLKHKRK